MHIYIHTHAGTHTQTYFDFAEVAVDADASNDVDRERPEGGADEQGEKGKEECGVIEEEEEEWRGLEEGLLEAEDVDGKLADVDAAHGEFFFWGVAFVWVWVCVGGGGWMYA